MGCFGGFYYFVCGGFWLFVGDVFCDGFVVELGVL